MPCYSPLKAYRTPDGAVFHERHGSNVLGDLELPCGQCIGCRMRRASDWALRVQHESSCWSTSCFVTLTYARDRLPALGSLDHRDFQLFLKRVRKHAGKKTIRFYMCGEYGPQTQRPHYHACLFNIDFSNDKIPAGKSSSGFTLYHSPTLTKLWGHGIATVQDLTKETAGYCARYIMKKALGHNSETAYQDIDPETGEITQRRPEYSAMSLRPGIGATWFEKFEGDVFPLDQVITNDGGKHTVPKYYDKLMRRRGLVDSDQVEYKRQQRAQVAAPDNTDERRKVRETVHTARVKSLKRELE